MKFETLSILLGISYFILAIGLLIIDSKNTIAISTDFILSNIWIATALKGKLCHTHKHI